MKAIQLDDRQQQRWDETRAAMTIAAPYFTHLFYTLMDNTGGKSHAFFTTEIPVAATDAKVVLLNPATYLPRSNAERVFILGHELLHNVFNDVVLLHYCARTGRVVTSEGNSLPFVPFLLQVAMDLRINDLLVHSKLGTLPEDAWHDTSLGTKDEPVVAIYERLFNKCKVSGKGGKPKPGQGKAGDSDIVIDLDRLQPGAPGRGKGEDGDSFDDVLAPGASGVGNQTPAEAAQERENAQETWDREIKVAIETARAQGRLPAAMDHQFEQIIEHKVPWQDHLEAEMARSFGGGSYNWKRPDRGFIVRDIYVPGRSAFACDIVAVACDTSGSITDEEIDISLSETIGILEELRPQRIILMWCDAKMHRADELTDIDDMRAIREKGAPGRGGTSFVPVFEYLQEQGIEPDALVYFTDGAGTFPDHEPNYPVIWGALILPERVEYPFGKVVEIPRA